MYVMTNMVCTTNTLYKYYVGGSKRYRILRFLYDPPKQIIVMLFMHLQDVVLFYRSDEERLAFEVYIEGHQNLLSDKISEITRIRPHQYRLRQENRGL